MIVENIIEICVAIDVAVLGIAYPIIIDKISNIGDKYSSEYIPVLFNNEFPQKIINITFNKKQYGISIFKLTLFVTLFSFIFLIFKLPPLFNWDNWLINNSAKLIVFALTVFLIVLFFIWLGKVALYNGRSKSILTHLINNYNKAKVDTEIQNYHLKAVNEIAFYAIEKQDEHLQETLLEFYFMVFASIRMNHDRYKPLIYPIDLYFLVNKVSKIAIKNETRLRAIEHRAISGMWLLGEDFEELTISQETYNWLWSNIYIIGDNPRLVRLFWANSSEYFNYRLQAVNINYDYDQHKIVNQEEIDERKEECEKFLEFHYALGGLMLYRKQYKTLKYMFEYTQFQPPKFILLPETMTEVFYWFENFGNEYKHRTPIDVKYYFPELDNLGNRRDVNYWICCYISILFLRQYSLLQNSSYQNFTDQPNLPDDILELGSWLDSVSYLKKCLNDILCNKDLIAELRFENLIEEKRKDFMFFITDLEDNIKRKIGQQKLEVELSEVKIQNFYSKSNQIISSAFDIYNQIFIKKNEIHSKGELKLSINGEKTLMPKSAFTDGDVPHLNYDTVFAAWIATNKIKRLIPNSFLIARTKRYLFNRENILLVLTKIIDGYNDIVIVGINISYQLKDILDKSDFHGHIQYIPSTERYIQDALFVLRRDDLPTIEYDQIGKEEIEKYKMQQINKVFKLYASVVDVNKIENELIRGEWNLGNKSDNQDLKVQLSIAFLSIIYWKEEREIIQIDIASEYREQGIQNDLNDIKPLSRENKNKL